jgi:hypothetical protein
MDGDRQIKKEEVDEAADRSDETPKVEVPGVEGEDLKVEPGLRRCVYYPIRGKQAIMMDDFLFF